MDAFTIIIICIFALMILYLLVQFYVKPILRRKRRRLILSQPFPSEWEEILQKNIPPYPNMPKEIQAELHGLVQIFLDEKAFEGCGEQEITDEIRITVAAQACILILNRKTDVYPRLNTILIYPSAYVAEGRGSIQGSVSKQVRLGESWGSGTVVLAWDHTKNGVMNFDDGHNVTLHEFAHQLDQEDGAADGAPILDAATAYREWSRILGEEFEVLCKKAKKGKKSDLDKYGATNPAEFFAVATETFFEKPKKLKRKHPELFEELKEYYKLDPADWD